MTIVLTPPGYASPPLRSSPLSKPPHNAKGKPSTALSSPTLTLPSRGSGPAVPIPRARRASSILAPSPLSVTVSPTTATSNPNPSPSPSSLSRSHPLLGSYPLSLLHARMSQHAPHTAADSFALYLKAVATGRCPAALRAPAPLTVPFVATYYDLPGGGAGASHTPWVADVDLEGWFFTAYGGNSQADSVSASTSTSDTTSAPASATAASNSGSSDSSLSTSPGVSLKTPSDTSGASSTAFPVAAPTTPPPHYPGYRVPPVGQLQIIVKTPSSAIKAYVLPYDLRKLPLGGRLLARERTYVVSPASTQSCPTPSPGGTGKSLVAPASPSSPETTPRRESLRYAVQLQFVCAPAPPDEPPGPAYYVARTLKLVFTSRPDTAETRVERTDEVVPPASATTPTSSPLAQSASPLASLPLSTPVAHPSPNPPVSPASPSPRADEWTRLRKKYLARTATVRGFTPTPSRPSTPASEAVALPPPRSLLSAFAPGDERPASPTPATPTKAAAREAREARRKARRSSKIERELSEKLRALDVGRE